MGASSPGASVSVMARASRAAATPWPPVLSEIEDKAASSSASSITSMVPAQSAEAAPLPMASMATAR